MDRWQLWRRVWFRFHRKNHSRRQYALATRTHSAPEPRDSIPPARYMLGRRHFSFISTMAAGITQRPKVLLEVDCSNLLLGGSVEYENFSSTCWLENHLHRFGEPANISLGQNNPGSYEFHGRTDLEASSSSADLNESYEDFSVNSADSQSGDAPGTSGSETGHSLNANSLVINLHRYPYIDNNVGMIEPPPYENEPPPTYEEAIAGSGFLDFEDENTDFMW
ncbi:uncharacterized protein [Littorina saxatilis]|uniref:Uncharacterized protein n=1 Tax=Littorina saxatilis TaxID=31220 RepID=A0AAN9GP43_9CAEN